MTPLVARVRSLWSNLVRRREVEQALDDELAAYIDLVAAEYERAGMSPAQARRQALVDVGGIEQVKEAVRDASVGDALATTERELRYALRSLRRSPTFLAVAIATLALGIGGATAVFTVINASLLRPLPATNDPATLVTVERVQPTGVVAEFSYPDYRDLRERSTSLEGLAAFNGTSMKLEDAAGTDRAWVSYVSDNFFTVLGVRAVMGRVLDARDSTAAAERVVVLGYDLWQRRFAGQPNVVGSTLKLEDQVYTIVGVAPQGFIGAMRHHDMELWIPIALGWTVDLTSRRLGLFRLVGRLAPGSTVERVQSELAGIAAGLATVYPTNRGRSVHVWAGAGMTAEERAETVRLPRLLAVAVGLLLLIACANVATLSLVRAAVRRRELATRLALGASRAALVRQLVLEGSVLAAAAGLLGVLIARALVRSTALVETVVPFSHLDLRLDTRVMSVAVAASALTAILVSLVPAFQVSRLSPGAVLKDGVGGAVRRRSVGQRLLVTVQVAASVVLLAGAAITFSAFQRLLAAHSAVDPRGLTDVSLGPRTVIRDRGAQLAFYRGVLQRAEADPSIADVALTTTLPPFQWASRVSVFRRGEEPPPGALVGRESEMGTRVAAVRISRDFFDLMRIPILRGRSFTATDDDRAAPVAIVSRRLADELWPRQNPVGRLVVWPAVEGPARAPLRVVGVAADTRGLSPTAEPPFMMYVPYDQHMDTSYSMMLVARGRGDAPVAGTHLRQLVAAVDSRVPVLGGRTLLDRLRGEARPQRVASAWVGVFGAISLLLAAIGLYGVVAQHVLQRTRELAVRAALGATPRNLLTLVLGDGTRLAALGAVVGVLGSLAAARVLQRLFTGVGGVNPVPAVVAGAALAIAVLAATYIPARRAAKLNPVDALRSD